MADDKNDGVRIPIFDGSDYTSYKTRLLMFLKMKKCKVVVEREEITTGTNTDDHAKWEEDDTKASVYIHSTVSNKQLQYIKSLTSARQMIAKFDQMYLKTSTALQIVQRNDLEKIKLQDYSTVEEFFDNFEKAVNELKEAGATLNDNEELNYMLKALPSSYSHIGDIIDVLPVEERTVEYVKSKIKLKDKKEKSEVKKGQESHKSNAFNTQMQFPRTCYGCGKAGHIQRDCWSSDTRGRGGHSRSVRGRGAQGSSHGGSNYGRGRGNNRSNDRGNFRGGYRGNYRGEVNTASRYQDHPENSEEGSNVFVTEVNKTEISKSKQKNNNEIEWILDSGCTDHIINDDTLFEQHVLLDKPVDVKLGDGRIMKATKVGRIRTFFIVNDREVEVTLRNVFFVRGMRQNLMSYAKVTDNNKIISQDNVSKIFNSRNELIAVARKVNDIYRVTSFNKRAEINSSELANKNDGKMSEKERWHRTLGHVNFDYLNTLSKNE